VTPARVAWAEASGHPLSATLVLKHVEGQPFRLLSARTSQALLQVTGLSAKAAVRQRVQVTLGAAAQPGTYDEKVFLTLDTPGHPEVAVRVVATLH